MSEYPLHVIVFYYLGVNTLIMAAVYAVICAVGATVRRIRR